MRWSLRLPTVIKSALIAACALPCVAIALVQYAIDRSAAGAALVAAGQGVPLIRLWFTLAMGLLGTALAIGLGRWVSGLILRPLGGLVAASEAMGRGDYGARAIPPATGAPVEVLAAVESFNRLADRLAEAHQALAMANQDLEGRVEQRTRELAQRTVDLSYSRSTLYAVMESLNDGLVLVTPDRRIRYANRNAEALLQLGESFYPGRSADELYRAVAKVSDETEERLKALGTQMADPLAGVTLTVNGAGAARYLRWRTFAIHNATGADLGQGHVLTDVTREHEVDRVKSELISTVSHELRTPLTAIRASISSLMRPNVDWDEETRQDFLQTISEESRHLQELIENHLDMSKIEAGMLRLDRYPVRVDTLVSDLVPRVRALYPDLTLRISPIPDLPALQIDPRRMQQVLLNLISNAVKYGGGEPQVDLRAERRGDEVWLVVTDQGIGIPPEHLSLIFDRFHRVDTQMTRRVGGNGLGLAICRGIVEAHGGRIWAESQVGQGSAFYVALPFGEEHER